MQRRTRKARKNWTGVEIRVDLARAIQKKTNEINIDEIMWVASDWLDRQKKKSWRLMLYGSFALI